MTGASDLYGQKSDPGNRSYNAYALENVQSDHDLSSEEYNTKSSKDIVTESQLEFTLPERKSR